MPDSVIITLTIVIVFTIFVVGFIFARYGNNKSYEVELTFDQIKDYFFKKHNCKDCNSRLKRISKDEFLGEGWSNDMGTYSYSKKYRRTYFLKCPKCNRFYTCDDY
jgi:uncharacterized protein with PIN domain